MVNESLISDQKPALTSIERGAYRALRRDIAELRLPPGKRLPVDELASQYQVSSTPIRQALRRLEGDGLVVTLRNRTFCVAPLSADELEEIQAIRMGVEGLLARLGAQRCTEAALAEMEAGLTELQAAYALGDIHGYLNAQRQLKDACYACASRPRLARVLENQRIRAERYIRLYLARDAEVLAQSRDHQGTFMDACRARDGAAAEAVIHEALELTLVRFRTMLEAADSESGRVSQ
jgi:DNA-binding GntR family transcriptional regulator